MSRRAYRLRNSVDTMPSRWRRFALVLAADAGVDVGTFARTFGIVLLLGG